ncbi:class I SAM-dependent methyltransferase [Cohnella endophytica]|uniref:Class I SAM-dependent methyltransferase n=1 Tax=Cohnella endophytica TaxID=2419778 RepID=A0A494XUR6_9BACL|nr:class I SAM-dependent methyltransferase [Cohnella endophytica]RKP54361.1 class I SAM-dependent methyltransferase [Cohnella endophytica]
MNYHDLLAWLGEGSAHPGGFEATKRLLRNMEFPRGSHVLEVGCGTGRTACYLARLGYDVTAVDRNPLMLEKARNRALRTESNVRFVYGDASSLPFPDSSFDLVFVESVTIFTKGDEAIKEYYRVLKTKGRLLDREMVFVRKTKPQQCRDFISYYGIRHVRTARGWEDLFKTTRFREVKASFIQANPKQDDDFDPLQEIDPRLFHNSWAANLLARNAHLMNKYNKRIASVLISANKNPL